MCGELLQQQQKANAVRFKIHKEGTEGPSDATRNLIPRLAFVLPPDFQNKAPSISSPSLPRNAENRTEGNELFGYSMRSPRQSEVHGLPATVCLVSGRTEVRTPDSWLPAQERLEPPEEGGVTEHTVYSPFCRWQIWFQWRPGSRCSKIHPVGQSRPRISPTCAEGRTPDQVTFRATHSVYMAVCVRQHYTKSDSEQRDNLVKKCNYLRSAECISTH